MVIGEPITRRPFLNAFQTGARAGSFGDLIAPRGASGYLQEPQTVQNVGRVKQLTGGSTTG